MKTGKVLKFLAGAGTVCAFIIFFQNCSPGFEAIQSLKSSSLDLPLLPGDVPIDPKAPLSVYVRSAEAIIGDKIKFRFELNKLSAAAVEVEVETADDTAIQNRDYASYKQTLTIAAGNLETSIEIPTYAAFQPQSAKIFEMRLNAVRGALVGQQRSQGRLLESSTPFLANDLASSTAHTCAITPSEKVFCWGANSDGQLGNLSREDSQQPVEVIGLSGAKKIATGGNHSCAILADTTVKCWGANADGQLGNNSDVDSLTPVKVQGLSNAKEIIASTRTTCAILLNNTVACWGSNATGQLGNGTLLGGLVAETVSGLEQVISLAMDRAQVCAVVGGGTVRCWGRYRAENVLLPTVVTGFQNAVQIVVGGNASAGGGFGPYQCIRTTNGTVQCAESSDTNRYLSPSNFANLNGLSAINLISATSYHSLCGLNGQGEVYCTGYNEFGQVGNWARPLMTAVKIGDFSGAKKIVSGYAHHCVLDKSNKVHCWGGSGTSRTLGSRFDLRSTYLNIGAPLKQVSIAENRACGVSRDEKVLCWGNVKSFPDRTTDFRKLPIEIPGLTGVKKVNTNSQCALLNSGAVRCWQADFVPTALAGLTTATDLDGSCAAMTDGTVYCWDASTIAFTQNANSAVPSRVFSLSGITSLSLSVGRSSTVLCAVTSNATVKCLSNALQPSEAAALVGNPAAVGGELAYDVMLNGAPLGNVRSVHVGTNRRCAVHNNGELTCWGRALYDALPATAGFMPPTRIAGFSNVRSVSITDFGICATENSGGVVCAGDSLNFSLGLPNVAAIARVPTRIGSLAGVTHMSISRATGLALLADGGLVQFGDDFKWHRDDTFYSYSTALHSPDGEIVFPKK